MQIEFVRHGETNYNILNLLNDIPHDKVYLTEQGIHEIRKVANNLKIFPAKKIYTSEFLRCKQTAEILNKYHKVPIVVSSLINEMKFGIDGQSSKILEEAIASKKDLPNMERISHMKKRIIEFLNQITENCIVVTHMSVIKILMGLINNLTDEQIYKIAKANRITITDTELKKILK